MSMFSHFFIRRPKTAFVLSILITLAGLISVRQLSVTMYPENITPPVVEIEASYPGASATVVEQSVVQPLEQAINGVKDMTHITSRSGNDGSATIRVFFKGGTNADINTVNVQNRVLRTRSQLPSIVNQHGVTVRQSNGGNIVMGINLYAPDSSMNELQMSSYADHYIINALARVQGVSKAFTMTQTRYSMRVWLNPERMQALQVTVGDVQDAVSEQNRIIAAGTIGAMPSNSEQMFEYSIEGHGRLNTPEEFGNIIVRANPDGSYVRLHDLARVELGSQSYQGSARLNNHPTVFIAITQLPDSSAIDVAAGVKQTIQALEKHFPAGLKAKIIFDSTRFISISVYEVLKTLTEAILLVILVVFIFLQNIRATLIPTLAIPVSVIGTFAFMNLFGISVNLISLFALVLAIGIVVDDAIIVIENTERHIAQGMAPKAAAHQSMKEIAGPVLATTFVLLAVFAPVAFIPGVSGQLFRQFSTVLSIAVLISALNALTLSPALCATLLTRGHTAHLKFMRPVERFFIHKITDKYNRTVQFLLKRVGRVTAFFVIMLFATGWLMKTLHSGFVPVEDQGYLLANIQLPDAASLNRTDQVLRQVTDVVLQQPGVSNINTISGSSLLSGTGSNAGFAIIVLKDWSERKNKQLHQAAIQQALQGKVAGIADANIQIVQPPAIDTGDTADGFALQLQDTQEHSTQELAQTANQLIKEAYKQPELAQVFTTFRANVPMYELKIDRDKVKALGVSLDDVYETLQTQLGSLYINDFNMHEKIYPVIIEAESWFRSQPDHLKYFYVRSNTGQMISIATFAKLEKTVGTPTINHFNLYRSVSINGKAASGYSSGKALNTMQKLADKLPNGYSYAWSGEAAQQIATSNYTPFLFMLAILFVYLILTALYESWAIPFVVLIIIPVAIFGAVAAIHLFDIENGIYCQIGMLLLIGMVAKSTILMAEFAVKCRANGSTIAEAAKAAAKLRFRAVLMTSLSFMLGVLPLVFTSGAGAESRFNISITIVGGMLTTTTAGILLTPVMYRIVQSLREKISNKKTDHTAETTE
ncbi:MAG: efflux RND transporter permease subunit [Endozoicomonadaceae bacterium]|nr:efflux RND transporter permease subunit [Endozoicomonadaceae bacterium]